MPRRVKTLVPALELPDGNLYPNSGTTVTLTDAQYGQLALNIFTSGALQDLGEINSPVLTVNSVAPDSNGNVNVSGGSTIKIVSQYVTSGSVTPPNTSSTWQALSGFEVDIAAVSGNWLEVSYNAMCQSSASTHYDLGLIVGSSIVYFFATGSSTPAIEGDPGDYPNGITTFLPHPGVRGVSLTSGLIDGANARVALVVKSNGTGLLYAETNYPFYFLLKNYGAHT